MSLFADEARRARATQQSWASHSVRERCAFLRPLRHLLVDRVRELSETVARDVLRDAGEVIGTDILSSAANAKWLERYAPSIMKPTKARGTPLWLWDTCDTIHRRPHGVVGIIGTWNYPIFLTLGAILPALVAGNGVFWKPSELAPHSANAIAKLLADAGVPQDLVIQLPATREAGPELCDADIDFLHFTGSDGVGRKIAARLGERLIPSTLELSGVDAFIVRADAEVTLAARTALYGATLNNGQTCMAARRAFVAKPLMDAFLAEATGLLARSVSDSVRPLVTEGQRTLHRRIVEDAKSRNLTVIGADLGPTLIVNPPPDFIACTQAAFSPVLSILEYSSDDDLIAKVTASDFGLSSAIFAKNVAAAEELAKRIPAGSMVINDVIVPAANPATPFGGRGASGWGSTQGVDGLLAFTVPQVVSVRKGTFRPHVDAGLTNDPAAADLMQGLLRLSHAKRWRDRGRGLLQLIGAARRAKKP